MRRPLAATAALLVASAGTFAGSVPARALEVDAPTLTTPVTVDAARELGPSNQDLGGVGWNDGAFDGVAPLAPPTVRIDAALDRLSTGEGTFDPDALETLEGKLAAVRSAGSEPQVILSYMPPWLARHFGAFDPRTPTLVGPSDLATWQRLVEQVVTTLATAPAPAYRFEVWNEPDLPVFWQDSPTAFFDLAAATHRAVAAVAARTGLPLRIGGPALAFPEPAFLGGYLERIRQDHLALDFVSWHYYGNYPFIGPDGAENTIPSFLVPAYPVAGQRNPVTSPTEYAAQTVLMRSWVTAALSGSGLDPTLTIDEWNLSAGGWDRRHDTHEGAAFDAASLMQMEEAGLDGADFYRAADTPTGSHDDPARVGDWGLIDRHGQRKPSWWVFDAWRRTAGTRLAASAGPPDVFTRATRHGSVVDILLASFAASGGVDRTADVSVRGTACTGPAIARTMTTPDGDLDHAVAVPGAGRRATVDLPSPSVAWVRFTGCQ